MAISWLISARSPFLQCPRQPVQSTTHKTMKKGGFSTKNFSDAGRHQSVSLTLGSVLFSVRIGDGAPSALTLAASTCVSVSKNRQSNPHLARCFFLTYNWFLHHIINFRSELFSFSRLSSLGVETRCDRRFHIIGSLPARLSRCLHTIRNQ